MTQQGEVYAWVTIYSKHIISYPPQQSLKRVRTISSHWNLFCMCVAAGERVCDLSVKGKVLMVECRSPQMQRVYDFVLRVAPTDLDVLITGEAGVGKEVIARQIHSLSRYREQALIKVDPRTLKAPSRNADVLGYRPQHLKEHWLSSKGSTLYIDELTRLDYRAQTRLLGIIMERDSGSPGEGRFNGPRILAATTWNLERAIELGRFREDLALRLKAVVIHVPPLRERREDIHLLAKHFFRCYQSSQRWKVDTEVVPKNLNVLSDEYHWPGNITELRDFIRQIAITGDSMSRAVGELRKRSQEKEEATDSLSSLTVAAQRMTESVERHFIMRALKESDWNRKQASQRLNISYRTLLEKMRKLEIG